VLISLPPVDPDLVTLGRRLHDVREARGLSLEDLAAAADIAKTQIAMAEQGRLRLSSSQLHAVVNALRLPLQLLFARSDLKALRRL
jgi:transcriptional regulator with XRE-family HTH domain